MNPASLEEALVHWAPGSRELELWFSDYIELPANAFIDYGDTEEISFHVFSVNHIGDGAFNGLSGLKRLYLPRSMITEVRQMTFSGLISLENLYLGQNRIAIIADEAFIELGNLKKLNLEKNNLSLITRRTLNGLRNLEHFDLSHNQLKSLESEMFGNTLNLKVLKLSNNMISTIEPGAFKGLRVIDSIELNDNYMQVIIPGTFQDLSSLKQLNLSKNRIVDLETGSLGGLTGLLDLQLKGNILSSVEKRVFAELPRPLILDIRNNPLLCNQNLCWLQREIQKRTILIERSKLVWGRTEIEDLTPNCDTQVAWNLTMKDCVIDELETWKQILERFRFNCCSVLLKYSKTGQWITTKYLIMEIDLLRRFYQIKIRSISIFSVVGCHWQNKLLSTILWGYFSRGSVSLLLIFYYCHQNSLSVVLKTSFPPTEY